MKYFDIIFLDLDGPILDGKFRHYQCYVDIVNKYGGEVIGIDEYWGMKRERVPRDVILRKTAFGSTYQDYYSEWMSNIENPEYLKLDVLKPNVIETLKQWVTLSEQLILITMRQNMDHLVCQLKALEIYSLFDEVILCPPINNNTKYDLLKNKKFSSAIFIGDTEEDSNTAKKLNIKMIGITNGLRNREHLEADYYFNEINAIDFFSLSTTLD